MNQSELSGLLDKLFDRNLLFYSFTTRMRDYDLFVYEPFDPRSGLEPRHRRFRFHLCTEVEVRSTVGPDVWARSLSDDLLHTEQVTNDTPGYAWGVQSQVLYPGATLVEASPRAASWQASVGVPFHEARIEGNAHEITLVFSTLSVANVERSNSPYIVETGGVAERYSDSSIFWIPPDEES